jgi:hypothetical protein
MYIASYDGTDNAEETKLSRQNSKRIKINDKVSVFLEDAINLDKWHKKI